MGQLEEYLKKVDYHTLLLLFAYDHKTKSEDLDAGSYADLDRVLSLFNSNYTVEYEDGSKSDITSRFLRVDCTRSADTKKICKYLNILNTPVALMGLSTHFWEEVHFVDQLQKITEKDYIDHFNYHYRHLSDLPSYTFYNASDTPAQQKARVENIQIEVKGNVVFMHDVIKGARDTITMIGKDVEGLKVPGARDAFVKWETWISQTHMMMTCKDGAKSIMRNIDDIWPKDATNFTEISEKLQALDQCPGNKVREYEGCHDYYCALWQNLHGMTVRADVDFDAMEGVEAFKAFVKFLLPNDSYREPTLRHMERVLAHHKSNHEASENKAVRDINAKAVTHDHFILFMWYTHLEINYESYRHRTSKDNSGRTLHPTFPPYAMCRECYGEDAEYPDQQGFILNYLKKVYTRASPHPNNGKLISFPDYDKSSASEKKKSWMPSGKFTMVVILALVGVGMFVASALLGKKKMKNKYKHYAGLTD